MASEELTARYAGYARPSALASPDWLQEHLDDPDVKLVEVDVNTKSYNTWHIDGAVLWDVYKDLKTPDYRPVDRATVERLLFRSGISPSSTVVFYGYAPALGLWLMQLHGRVNCRLLDYGKEAWKEDGRPWATGTSTVASAPYPLDETNPQIRADMAVSQQAIGNPGVVVLDVRSKAEYNGECFWPSGASEPGGRQGHIPSALHQPIDGLYDEQGAFVPSERLRQVFSAVVNDGKELITYCTIGGRACTAWFVLTYLLGRDNVRVYDGSWAEWGRDPLTAVA